MGNCYARCEAQGISTGADTLGNQGGLVGSSNLCAGRIGDGDW